MCGFIQSTLEIVPENLIGLLLSYSASNEWCANSGAVTKNKKEPTTKPPNNFRVIDTSCRFPNMCRLSEQHSVKSRIEIFVTSAHRKPIARPATPTPNHSPNEITPASVRNAGPERSESVTFRNSVK